MNLTMEFKAKTEKFNELYQTLHALLPTMRAEAGCHESRIYQNLENVEIFCLSSDWKDAANIKHYIQSTCGSALLGAVDLLSQAVRVSIEGDYVPEGIEFLKQMRK